MSKSSSVRRLSVIVTIFMLLMLEFAGPLQVNAEMVSVYGEPVDLGTPIESVVVNDSAYGIEDGRNVLYATVAGSTSVFNVIDLDEYKLLRSYPMPGASSCWSHVTDSKGNVYAGTGGGKMFRYSPVTKQLEDLGIIIPGETAIYGLCVDENDNVYGGTFPNGKVFKFNAATSQFEDFGTTFEGTGQKYVRSAAYYKGFVYAGTGTTGRIIKVNIETKEKELLSIPDRPEYYNISNLPYIYGMDIVDHYLFANISGNGVKALIIYDLDNGVWLDQTFKNYVGLYVSPKYNNKVYFNDGNKIIEFDLTTHATINTGIGFGTYLRHCGWVDIENDPDLPGMSMVTVQYGGSISFINLQTKKVKTLPPIFDGIPTPIQTLEKGPDGKLYMSGYPGGNGAIYDPSTGSNVRYSLGQAEGMWGLGNKMYMGIYPGADIQAVNTEVQPKAASLFKVGDEQDRPFVLRSGEGKLFIGTIPGYGKLGGALTIYNPATSERKTYRNVVNNQSIIGLAYRDGKLYGSTSVSGGLGIAPTETEAKIFVWDIAKEEKIADFTPDIPNSGVVPQAIGGLDFGPDGLLWGVAHGTIFAINPDTYEVVKSKLIYPCDWNFDHYWRPVQLRWGEDDLLYTTLGFKLTVIDPETLDYIDLGVGTTALMTLSDNGDIYYASGANIYRIDVTNILKVGKILQKFIDSEKISGPLVPQLTNSLEQAQHQLDNGFNSQAAKHLEDFSKHLNNKALSSYVSEDAKTMLSAEVEKLIESWNN